MKRRCHRNSKKHRILVIAIELAVVLFSFAHLGRCEENDGPYCGIYAMYGAAAVLGETRAFEDLVSEKFVSGLHGSTSSDLIKCAEFLNVKAGFYSGLGPESLRSAREPLILHVSKYGYVERYNHWLLFLGMDDFQTCRIADDDGEMVKISLAEILSQWDGSALLVSRSDSPLTKFDAPEFASFGTSVFVILLVLGGVNWLRSVNSQRRRRLIDICAICFLAFLPFAIDVCKSSGLMRNSRLVNYVFQAVHPIDFVSIQLNDFVELQAEKRVQIVDARYRTDYSRGHIKGAVNIPVDLAYATLLRTTKNMQREVPTIIYCQSEGCRFSDHVAVALLSQGFTDVRIFRGGWEKWQEERER